jgi:hypothetical protein
MQCLPCNMFFESEQSYLQHKASVWCVAPDIPDAEDRCHTPDNFDTLSQTFTKEPYASLLLGILDRVRTAVIQEHGGCNHEELRQHMTQLMCSTYGISDPRLVFMVHDMVSSNGTPLDQDRKALATVARGQHSILQPWMILTGAPMSWTFSTNHTWQKIDLGGTPRWQKAITCDLGNEIDVLSAYALKNTDCKQADLFQSQRPHQHLHCDLPNPRVVDALTSLVVADAVYVWIAPLGDERIALRVWDHSTHNERTLWVQPGEYMVFPSASCWHAGYGGKQGARLYVTFVVGKLTSYEKECVTRDQLEVLLWKHIHGTPSPNPADWRMKNSSKN